VVDEEHALGSVGGSGTGSLRKAETGAPVVADTLCWGLSHVSGKAGTDEHYKHVIRSGRGAESFKFPIRSMARSVVETSTTRGYRFPNHTVVSPTNPLLSVYRCQCPTRHLQHEFVNWTGYHQSSRSSQGFHLVELSVRQRLDEC